MFISIEVLHVRVQLEEFGFFLTIHFCLLDEQFKLEFWVRLITVCTCGYKKYLASITPA